jgi:hypothetical protein
MLAASGIQGCSAYLHLPLVANQQQLGTLQLKVECGQRQHACQLTPWCPLSTARWPSHETNHPLLLTASSGKGCQATGTSPGSVSHAAQYDHVNITTCKDKHTHTHGWFCAPLGCMPWDRPPRSYKLHVCTSPCTVAVHGRSRVCMCQGLRAPRQGLPLQARRGWKEEVRCDMCRPPMFSTHQVTLWLMYVLTDTPGMVTIIMQHTGHCVAVPPK